MQLGYTMLCEQTAPRQLVSDEARGYAARLWGRASPGWKVMAELPALHGQ